jgi:hypothetical protein
MQSKAPLISLSRSERTLETMLELIPPQRTPLKERKFIPLGAEGKMESQQRITRILDLLGEEEQRELMRQEININNSEFMRQLITPKAKPEGISPDPPNHVYPIRAFNHPFLSRNPVGVTDPFKLSNKSLGKQTGKSQLKNNYGKKRVNTVSEWNPEEKKIPTAPNESQRRFFIPQLCLNKKELFLFNDHATYQETMKGIENNIKSIVKIEFDGSSQRKQRSLSKKDGSGELGDEKKFVKKKTLFSIGENEHRSFSSRKLMEADQ